MRNLQTCLLLTFAVALSAVSVDAQIISQSSTPVEKRQARIDDDFARESIIHSLYADIGVIYSPDGQVVAFVRRRAKLSLPAPLQSDFLLENVADDIWIHKGGEESARNLTNGTASGSGAWEPKWSPDGKRLAFLSTRGGGITLWQWDRAADRVMQISRTPVIWRDRSPMSFAWISDREVVFGSPPAGQPSRPETYIGESARQPTEHWEKAARGEVTGSVVKSTEFCGKPARIIVADVTTGRERRIADTILERYGFYTDWWLAPTKTFIVYRRSQVSEYGWTVKGRMGWPIDMEIRRLDGSSPKLQEPLPKNIHERSMKWSPDGRELVFFANAERPVNPVVLFGEAAAEVIPDKKHVSVGNPAKLYRLNLETGVLGLLSTGDIDLGQLGAPDFEFTTSGDLLFNAARTGTGGSNSTPAARGPAWGATGVNAEPVLPSVPREWWIVGRDGATRKASESEVKAQPALTVQNLTRPTNSQRTEAELIDPVAWEKFDRSAKKPAPDARLMAISPAGDSGIYSVQGQDGVTRFLRVGSEGKTVLLASLNEYLKGIRTRRRGQTRYFEYTSTNGQKLWGRLDLPDGYVEGRRYPVIVQQYPGIVLTPPANNSVDAEVATGTLPSPDSLAGFVVLEASVPRNLPGMSPRGEPAGGEEANSLFMVPNGVMPAVQELIDMGIADPDRIVVQGASSGGWGALALAVQTTRFKAIVAECPGGIGTQFDAFGPLNRAFRYRYRDSPAPNIQPNSVHFQLGTTDVPWWRDGRTERNDPLRYVDRVQTPVMLVHGDLDLVDFNLSQDFFNALVSMRKPAEFVRYWGAGHNFRSSPANARDYYARKFAWIDRWCDIARDEHGNMIWDGDRVKGRNGTPSLKPEDYAKFDIFQPSPARQEKPVSGVGTRRQ